MKGQTAGRREGLAAGARQRGGIARTVGRREKGGREGKRSGRPPGGRPPSPGGTGWQRTRVLPRGFPSPGGSAVPGAAPRGGGGCGRSAALPGLPLGSRPAPFPAPANDYISQHFPLPSGLCGGASPALAISFPRRGLGGAELGSRGPAAPPHPPFPRAGAEPAAHGGGSRGGTRRRRLSGAAGSAMRAAACLLSLALCALPAAPGEPRPRGSAAALGAGGAVGMDGVVVGDAAPRAAAEPRGNGAPAPACAPAARGAAG